MVKNMKSELTKLYAFKRSIRDSFEDDKAVSGGESWEVKKREIKERGDHFFIFIL